MKQEVMVYMLPTNQVSHLGKFKDSGKLVFNTHIEDIDRGKPQHLYLTTDEEIKDGDKATNGKDICDIIEVLKSANILVGINKLNPDKFSSTLSEWRKIVATTNPEVQFSGAETTATPWLPIVAKIPLSFIKEYVEKQGKIEKVWLECAGNTVREHKGNTVVFEDENGRLTGVQVEKLSLFPVGKKFPNIKTTKEVENWRIEYRETVELKLNSDGSVIILPNEEKMYTRKELRNACIRALGNCRHLKLMTEADKFEEWFDKNYPK